MQQILGTLTGLATMVPYMAMGFLAIWFADRANSHLMMTTGDVAGGNVAAGVRVSGLFIALGIGLSGVFAGNSRGFLAELAASAGYGVGLIAAMVIALKINDWMILPTVSNSLEIKKGNVAVAAVEFGGMIATGLIAKGAVMGESGGWQTSVVFFVLGQGAMVLLVFVYERLKRQYYSLVEETGRGNAAAGILLGGELWAYGLIMSAAVSGNFAGWEHDIIAFAITAVSGMVFLYVAEWMVDEWIVTQYTAKEIVDGRHVQPALVLAAGKIGMAYVISTVAV